jgi:hypothetical protein
MTEILKQSVLLGRGGNSPGIEAYSAISGTLEKILSLTVGQSVYAIDISPDGDIVAGTKTSDIYWLRQQGHEASGFLVEQFANCAPILDVCFVDERTVAVSDTAGRCLLWQLRKDAQPDKLPRAGGVVFSLFRLDDRHLAGLSVFGQLLVWDLAERNLAKVVEVPPPPDLSALVKPVYWLDSWAWPARGGIIVLYKWRTNDVHTICTAHSGDVYAVVVCGDELLTIGKTDRFLKRWQAGCDTPAGSLEVPHGIISAALWCSRQSRRLLLINDAGQAGIYSWTDGKLNLIKQLAGQDYRIAFGPDMERLKSAMQHQEKLRVKELSAQINNKIAQRVYDDELQSFYQQLTKLGYRQVALGLQGLEAGSKNDLVAEIKIYRELVDIIQHEHPGSEKSLLRYAELLESVWQPQNACRIFKKLARIYPDNNGYAESMFRVSKQASIIEDGNYIIESDIQLPLLARSAVALCTRFTGRYLVKNIKAQGNCNVIISAGELIEKYEQISKTRPHEPLPQAEEAELCWLSKEKTEQITTVIFASKDTELFSCLELGVKFFNARLQTVLIPVVMFNAGKDVKGVSVEQHNGAVLKNLQHIENNSLSNAWLQMVHRNINHAIRQLITRALACRGQ